MKRLKLFFACLLMAVLSIGQVWGETCTLTSAQIKAGSGSTSYGSCSATDGCSKTWNAYAIKNQHSKATADYHFWQIKKYASSTAYYVQVPEMAGNITQLKITVSSSSKARDGGDNSATLFFSSSNSTSAEGTGVVSGTGASSVTIDCSSLNLATGYITAGAAVRIWDVEVTYSGSTPEPAVKSVQFTPNGGEFLGSQSVTLSQEDNKAIYYTYDAEAGAGTPSTSSPWALYESALNLTATTTIYAAAKDGSDWSAVTSKTFTKIEPLNTMDAIFAAATAAGSTATDVYIDFQNWVVSGANGKTAYVTDGTKGFIIYYDSHGFAEGDILSGVGSFKIKLYNGAAEITAKNSGTITITKGGTAQLNELDADGISALSGINTGSLIKINGTCSVSSGKYYINNSTNTVQVYTTLYSFTSNPPEATKEYNCTGVYVQYNATKEIMPRKAADIAEVVPAGAPEFTPASKKFVGSISVELSQENSLPIYYTDDASKKDAPSITTWTEYTSAIPVTATKTIYAAAKDGDDWSDVSSATYTKAEPLTTMADVQAAATQTYDQLIDVAITNWVVTAVDNITGDNKRVWIADADNEKGILLYASSYTHGFTVGKKLNGTVLDTKIKAYQGYAELTSLKAADVDVTDAEAITARTTTIADLATGRPAEQGTIVKLENVTYNGTNFSDGENSIYIDTRLYEPTLTDGKKYNLTGVVFYSSATSINLMPRSAADVEELASMELTSITLGGTYPTTFETGDAFSHEGMVVTAHYDGAADAVVTALAEYSGYNMSVADDYTVTVSYTENEITKTAEYSITVSDPAPTGDFELLEGELVAGDYLIYDDGSLMKAEISSGRFAYEEATPDANGIISNPSQYAVWTLAKSGDYWTFYNAKAGKYAAGTGVANKAQLLADGTDDKSLWSINGDLVVTNKANAAAEVNATLRHNFSGNTNYGFACYSATQGGKPLFYKQATPSYYISETLTGCSADANNPTKVPQTLTEDVVLKYNLTTGYVWPDAITVEVGGVALDPNELDYLWDNTQTPAELTIDYTKVNGNIAVSITAIEKELNNITVAQAPNKVAYETGEFFNPAGLRIQLNYTAGASDVVEYSNLTAGDFTFSPGLETELAPENTEVEITYGGKSVNQAITVTNPVAVEKTVVVIAEYDSKLYAMSNAVASSACAAIEVTKDGDDLVVTSEANKAAVQWFMSKLGSNVKLQVANNEGQYLSSASSDGNLSLSDVEVNWTLTEDGNNYLFSIGDSRALLYRTTGVFKHYAKSNLINNPDDYFAVSELFEVAEGATNIKVVVPVVYEFTIDPDEAVAFGTVEQGDDVAAKSFDVTLTNIASATVTLSDAEGAFSINTTALTENGTITVTPNTENVGNFSATITLSDDAGVAADKVINVTMNVVTPKDCDRTDDFNTVSTNASYTDRTSTAGWTAVNTAVTSKNDITYWMICGGTDKTGIITSPEFNDGIGKLSLDYYIPYAEDNGISFKVDIKQNGSVVATRTITKAKADVETNTVYSSTIEDFNIEGKFQIVITNLCPANKTGNKDRFAIGSLCWKTYGDPDYGTYHRDVTSGNYGTICLPKNGTITGATLFNIVDKSTDMIYIEEVGSDAMEAGKPYIFQATADQLNVTYTDGTIEETPGNANGLYGFYNPSNMATDAADKYDIPGNAGNYILYGNQYWFVDNVRAAYINNFRAYIKIDMINYTVPAPGRRRIGMVVNGEQVVTGIDALNASETPVKVIINGQLFILRGEKMYNANGQIVK